MGNAADQPRSHIVQSPAVPDRGIGKVEQTTLPNSGVIDTRMRQLAGVATGRIEVSTAPLTNIKV